MFIRALKKCYLQNINKNNYENNQPLNIFTFAITLIVSLIYNNYFKSPIILISHYEL